VQVSLLPTREIPIKKEIDLTEEKNKRDDSHTKTSNERTHCNSSIINAHRQGLGTVFSFKSQKIAQPEIPSFPISPTDAIRFYGSVLTEFEKTEILEYPSIYFLGG